MPRSRRRLLGWGWIFGVLWSFTLGTLIFLSASAPHGLKPPRRLPVPTPTAHPSWTADFPTRIEQVTAALQRLPWPLPSPVEKPQGAGTVRWIQRQYALLLPKPHTPDALRQVLEPVRQAARGVTVDVRQGANGADVQIGVDGLLTHTLVIHWLGHRPRVAIIIDDLGNDLRIAHAFARLDAPLTFAVMPFRPFSREVAKLATLLHRQVLLHLPMEAENGEEFGAREVLRLAAGRSEILRELDDSLASVPHVVGVNNHMGSRLTADRQHMRWILERLKQKGLFFVDSLTTPHSVACEVATTISLPCAARDIFLDDVPDEAAVRAQIAVLLRLARDRGDAIAIGHPRPATLAALQAAVPQFATAGVEVVPVSTVVADEATARSLSVR